MLDFTSLYIYPDCQYRKNIEAGRYPFNQWELPDFYGKNVRLHAIVGKNGSGKSSVLDVVLRIINNVGATMCRLEKRDASDRMRYVRHIHADLCYKSSFVIDGDLISMGEGYVVREGMLCVRDVALWLKYGDDVFWLSDDRLMENNEASRSIKDKVKSQANGKFHDYGDMSDSIRKHDIASKLFYTIATNYSMLGFQANDYAMEESLEYQDKAYLATKEGLYITADGQRILLNDCWADKKNWITGVFHKNDGYMCPLVLNPYRDGGIINMNNEASLTVSRLSALLLTFNFDKTPLIDDYQLDYIEYAFKKDFYQRFRPIYVKEDKSHKNLLEDGGDLKYFVKAAKMEWSWSWTVLDEFDIPITDNLTDVEIAARLYIAYKVFNIAATYPYYSPYRKYGKINKVFYDTKIAPTPARLRKLVREIEFRKTHVELKVHQALNFVRKLNELRKLSRIEDTTWLKETFTFSDYVDKVLMKKEFGSIDDCMMSLPPNIFRQTIYMKRVVDEKVIAEKIPFSRMSSGQRQMLFQLSTLMYHMLNLKSVPHKEIRYHNVNLILDEIEVCFHPEYQRMFLTRMLDLLCNKLHLNDDFGIHIWLTTHSPFILSDVPDPLITYMKDGHLLSNGDKERMQIKAPMAANISDLLHQSFFLEQGFIGEYSRRKILDAISFMRNDAGGDWTEGSLNEFIKGIGEPFIKKNLVKLWEKKYEKDFD